MSLSYFYTTHTCRNHQAFLKGGAPLSPAFRTEIELAQYLTAKGIDLSTYNATAKKAPDSPWYNSICQWHKK